MSGTLQRDDAGLPIVVVRMQRATITPSRIESAIARGKREILSDIASGRVPSTIDRFADLHDYVDANEYGGLCDEDVFPLLDDNDFDVANRVQNALDSWLVAGRP